MRILFIGCVKSSRILLQKLIDMNESIVGVITKKESKFNSDFNDLTDLCIDNNIDYKFTRNINDVDSLEYIRSKTPDVIYCFGWSQIIKKELMEIPPKGIIGFHPTELPNNKGRHPIIWALTLGLKNTASSFFFIDEGADTGDILSQCTVNISYSDNAESLYNKIMDAAVIQMEKFTSELKNNNFNVIRQDNHEGNYWRKRSKLDGKIDWRMNSLNIYNLVRALSKPYIGAHFEYNNADYKVWKVEEVKNMNLNNIEFGKVIEVYSSNSFLIKVGDECIKVLQCDDINLKEGDYL
ncbi:methionyl-tRNA formyltransferase [Clostridium punense]|uniref:Methionyl-tRNA formyltransferase n=1 Tax=Clostridium punense TaxID=1054297 RepID=A0ABS4K583_9CLOT|nr:MULTISPECIES: formyltransferase family protein [Clostridium]EQB87122.1 hypothetical protein M918_10800 [Clostridium sp. BL8]MBP2021814.1 methionyl-tRNA formyltransferase [Clostridium punense]